MFGDCHKESRICDNKKDSVQEEEQLQQEKASFFLTESRTGTTGSLVHEGGRSGSDVQAEDKEPQNVKAAFSFLSTLNKSPEEAVVSQPGPHV